MEKIVIIISVSIVSFLLGYFTSKVIDCTKKENENLKDL